LYTVRARPKQPEGSVEEISFTRNQRCRNGRRRRLLARFEERWLQRDLSHSLPFHPHVRLRHAGQDSWRANHHPDWVRAGVSFKEHVWTADVRRDWQAGERPNYHDLDQSNRAGTPPSHRFNFRIQAPSHSPIRVATIASPSATRNPLTSRSSPQKTRRAAGEIFKKNGQFSPPPAKNQ